jgi:hypothetical protein
MVPGSGAQPENMRNAINPRGNIIAGAGDLKLIIVSFPEIRIYSKP